MRKLTLFLLISLLILSTGYISAAEHDITIIEQESNIITRTDNDINMRIGFDLPTIGWARYNEHDQLVGWRGVNAGIGYSQINYFEPMEMGEWNPFWEWGTLILIIPYAGVGAEYPMEMNDGDNYLSFTGGVGLYGVRVGASYAW